MFCSMRHAVNRRAAAAAAVFLIATLAAGRAHARGVVYETNDPFGSPFGFVGFDVFEGQSVGVRFTPDGRHRLDRIGVWFMNNDFGGEHFDTVTLTLRDDGASGTGRSIPGTTIIESWSFRITAVGWDPKLETVVSALNPILEAGVNYWVVAEANVPPFTDPVWVWAARDSGYTSTTDSTTGEWQDGGEGAVAATIVEGTRLFDLATNAPVSAGQDLVFSVTGARPNARTYLVYGTSGLGETPAAPLCVTLGILAPKLLGLRQLTNESGETAWRFRVPARAAGRTAWAQAAQRGGVSDVETVMILP